MLARSILPHLLECQTLFLMEPEGIGIGNLSRNDQTAVLGAHTEQCHSPAVVGFLLVNPL